MPKFDELGRPAWLFTETVHRHCPKAGYYEEGVFAEEPGDNQCLVEIGCWGPVVQCNIVERGAINNMGGCMVAGGACIGCTMPGFPDKFSPFYKAAPGSAISGGVSKVTGGAIRRLRRMSMKSGNTRAAVGQGRRGPLRLGRGQSAAAQRRRQARTRTSTRSCSTAARSTTRKRNKKQPLPQSRNILESGRASTASVGVHREEI